MASDSPPLAPPVVLLDANLLYPFYLRSLLVQFGVERLIDVRWTDAIHEEWIGHLVADGRATRERLTRTLEILRRALPGAEVRGYEHRIAGLSLPDTGDRHVLAAAIEANASVLLTFNLADFPSADLAVHGIAPATRTTSSASCTPAIRKRLKPLLMPPAEICGLQTRRWTPSSTRSNGSVLSRLQRACGNNQHAVGLLSLSRAANSSDSSSPATGCPIRNMTRYSAYAIAAPRANVL